MLLSLRTCLNAVYNRYTGIGLDTDGCCLRGFGSVYNRSSLEKGLDYSVEMPIAGLRAQAKYNLCQRRQRALHPD
jgi:hypothetical protein